MTERLITAKEAGLLLSVHPVTIYRLAVQGRIPSLKIGKSRRFRESELVRWVEEESGRNEGDMSSTTR